MKYQSSEKNIETSRRSIISVLLVFNHFFLYSFKYFPPKCIILYNLIIKRLLYCNYSYFYIRSCINLHSISASRMLLRSNVMIWKYNALFLFKFIYVCCLFCMCVCVCVFMKLVTLHLVMDCIYTGSYIN